MRQVTITNYETKVGPSQLRITKQRQAKCLVETRRATSLSEQHDTSLLKSRMIFVFLCLCTLVLMSACRGEDEIIPPDVIPVTPPEDDNQALIGFYLLNEGNMGSNKSTLDYFDYATGEYHRNIFAAANPSVPKELGDVGSDLKIYGGRLYAVINCSNKIEVMDKRTARRIGQIDIPNCRFIRFHGAFAYVTSYAGPVEINPNYEQIGFVAKVDTATLQVVARCLVGFQPDELAVVGEKIYVANSGGYRTPNYENTVSVIDIATFKEIKRVEVAVNLYRMLADSQDNLWITSRGNSLDVPSRLFWMDTKADTCGGMLDIPVSNFCLDGDSLYILSSQWSNYDYDNKITYGIVDVAKKQVVARNFITDGEDSKITMPYGIMVNPVTKDIYLTDAGNYVYPGVLICFDHTGKKKWQVQTGDIPAHFAFVYKK